MSSGHWQLAGEWNRGGPVLYAFFWIWLLFSFSYAVPGVRSLLKRIRTR